MRILGTPYLSTPFDLPARRDLVQRGHRRLRPLDLVPEALDALVVQRNLPVHQRSDILVLSPNDLEHLAHLPRAQRVKRGEPPLLDVRRDRLVVDLQGVKEDLADGGVGEAGCGYWRERDLALGGEGRWRGGGADAFGAGRIGEQPCEIIGEERGLPGDGVRAVELENVEVDV